MTRHPGQVEADESAATLMARPLPSSLGAFCAAQAKTHGDAIAIDFFQEGVMLSYAALHHRSNRIAANLLARGFRKGAHIAVMLPNGPASVLVWFAIMKIGAVIVPVNTAYGGKELDFQLNHSDAQSLIIDAPYLAQLDEMQQRPLLLSDPIVIHGVDLGALEEGGPLADFDPGYPVVATDQASVQYTSGTTGFPKGCMLTQDYWLLIAHSVAQVQAGYGCSRLFYWAPFFYMDGQWSFLSAIALGGRAIIASQMSLTKYLGWLRDHNAHFCVLPEPVLKTVPATPQDADLPVKFAFTFGWRPSARAEAEARFNLIARDGFGMTEVGTALSCPRAAGDKLAVNTVGLPSPWRETRVVDESGKECPPGVPGELQIRGRSILLGYYKRPDANAQAFDGDWFRSGDLFVRDADGYHRIVGRLKEMIKRSGENISATEVEAAMREAPEISEAAAIAVPDPMRREEVMILVKLAPGLTPDDMPPEAIARHAERLAAFKRPRYVTYMSDFPRTATNKIAKSRITFDTLEGSIHDLQKATILSAESARLLVPSKPT